MKALSVKILIVLIVAIIAVGCASIFGERAMQSTIYSSNIGAAWHEDIEHRIPRMLQLYGYTLREERIGHDYSRFTTNWEYRNLYPDEIQAGIVTARIRVTVESSSRGKTSTHGTMPDRSSVSLLVENSFILGDSDEWVAYELGEGLQEFIHGLETEIRRQLEIRI